MKPPWLGAATNRWNQTTVWRRPTERTWEDKPRALRQAEEAVERFADEPAEPTLPPERREQPLHLSQRPPALWSSPHRNGSPPAQGPLPEAPLLYGSLSSGRSSIGVAV